MRYGLLQIATGITECDDYYKLGQYSMYTVVGVNILREMFLSPNDEEIPNFSKKHTQFKTRVHKPYPISDQNGRKTIPFGAAHTYIAYIRDYPPGRKTRCRLGVSLLTQARLSRARKTSVVQASDLRSQLTLSRAQSFLSRAVTRVWPVNT